KLHFCIAKLGKGLRFPKNAVARAAALRSAGHWNYAVGAGFIAAFNDGDIRAMGIVTARKGRIESFIGIEAQAGDPAIARLELHKKLRKFCVAGRSGHQTYVRSALKNPFAL